MPVGTLRTRVLTFATAISLLLLGAATLAPPSAQGADPFTAHGSARQVYVLGLPAGASATLLDSAGQTVATQDADSLGGLLYRDVAPGTGYRVREDATGTTSGPVTVRSEAAAPWDPSIYDQSIP